MPADRTEDYLKEGKLAFKDGMAAMDPSVLYRGALRYAMRFSNRKGESAGLSNQAFVAPVLMPGPPAGLRAEVAQDWIRLSWDAAQRNMDGSAPAHLAGYNVYRSEDPAKFPPAPLNAEPLEAPSFDDRAFEFGRTYHYAVSVVGSRSNPYAESRPSTLLAVQPRDTFPPDAPGGLQAVQAGDAVLLLWIAPPQRDIAGYRVSRKEEGAEAAPLSSGLVAEFSFRDGSVRQGRKYQYQVAAVDKAGNTGPAAVVAFELP